MGSDKEATSVDRKNLYKQFTENERDKDF